MCTHTHTQQATVRMAAVSCAATRLAHSVYTSRRFRNYTTSATSPQIPVSEVMPPYEKLASNLARFRANNPSGKGPLSLAEKILYAHLENPLQEMVPGETYLKLMPGK